MITDLLQFVIGTGKSSVLSNSVFTVSDHRAAGEKEIEDSVSLIFFSITNGNISLKVTCHNWCIYCHQEARQSRMTVLKTQLQ